MAVIFSSGFETGNLTEWSSAATDGGHLSAAAGAALHGSYGLNCYINDNTAMNVTDTTPASATTYRMRFYIDPNSITMANNDTFYLAQCDDAGFTKQAILVQFNYTSVGGYKIVTLSKNDSGGYASYTSGTLTDAPHCFEVYFKAATSAGANDGIFQAWVDGSSIGSTTNIDNDAVIVDQIRFGAISGIDTGTRGTFFLDDFVSNDDGSEIGLIDTATLTGTATASITEADIVAGGKTIILTITGDTWVVAAGGLFDAQRQNIINGLDSAQSEATGWDAEVKAKIPVTDVVRTSNTVVTITLSAEAGYNITAQETITATVPATALLFTVANVVAVPTFTIDTVASSVHLRTLMGAGV